jgi:hypothetical protein
MDYQQALKRAKLLPNEYREEFEERVVNILEEIIENLPEEKSENFNSKDKEKTQQQKRRQEAYQRKKAKEAHENLERIETNVEYVNEKITDYKTGYYSEEETRKRFQGMPETTIENCIYEHRLELSSLEKDLRCLNKEREKWQKYL